MANRKDNGGGSRGTGSRRHDESQQGRTRDDVTRQAEQGDRGTRQTEMGDIGVTGGMRGDVPPHEQQHRSSRTGGSRASAQRERGDDKAG